MEGYQQRRCLVDINKTGGVATSGSVESTTDFSGLISGETVPAAPPPGKKVPRWKYFLTVIRKVDWLSPQFASALTTGKNFPKVTIQTPSGHVVTLRDTLVVQITKAGYRNPLDPGSPPVGPAMEAIEWESSAPILVDGHVGYASYDWSGLNS
jgi:hypothetical protein